jgi:outer membrane protein assembly factor BamA
LIRDVGAGIGFSFGPLGTYFEPQPAPGSPAALLSPLGADAHGAGGLRLTADLDATDSSVYPRKGIRLGVVNTAFPLVWGQADDAFGKTGVTASAYLPLPMPLETTVAIKAGGERIWGNAPLQHLAFLGGGSSVRGYSSGRFVGDASAFSNLELRVRVTRAKLVIARGDLGFLALADAGQVWWENEDSKTWHTALGGGIWFGPLSRTITAHALYAYGDGHNLSAGIGMPF